MLATKKKKTTLKDVAKKAGVSLSAASQILNDRRNFCSEEKKTLVKQVARDLNYKVNLGYRIMTGMKTNTVGILFSAERVKNEEHIMHLTMMLSSRFECRGFSVYMATFDENGEGNFQKMLDMVNRGCSSFILIGMPFGSDKIEEYCESHDINYIGYNAVGMKRNIVIDSSFAVKSFINSFMAKGYTNFKLAFPKYKTIPWRLAGLYQAFPNRNQDELKEQYCYDIPVIKNTTSPDILYKTGYTITKEIMSKDSTTNGIVYLSDYYAIGGAKYLTEKGYKIGEDILICGYNNTSAARYFPYPIATADHDIPNLCDKLLKYLDDKAPCLHTYTPKLILKGLKH